MKVAVTAAVIFALAAIGMAIGNRTTQQQLAACYQTVLDQQ